MAKLSFKSEWKNDGTHIRLLKTLNEGTSPDSDGNITFIADDHNDLFFLLSEGLSFEKTVTARDASAIAYRSFLDLRKHGPVSEQELLTEIAKRTSTLEQKPKNTFTMWTKCRFRQMDFHPVCRIEIDGVAIRTSRRLPRTLQLSEHFVSGVGRIDPNTLPFFGHLIFTTKARNENEANKKIFSAADLFNAIVNTSWRSLEFWPKRRPSAKLWNGPYQFFFNGNVFLGENRVWYNESFEKEEWNLFPASIQDFRSRLPQIRKILRCLQAHPLQAELTNVLMLVSDGMISKNLSLRLMRFWSAAEALYSKAADRTNSKKLINRLTFMSKDNRWLDRLKLERCYNLRNIYVHHGTHDNDDTSLTQHLREIILSHVYYYLFNASDILTHDDLLMMVDLPEDETILDSRIVAIERCRNLLRFNRHTT